MASAGTFYTRVQLKYDTWSNWNTDAAKALVPLKGEVCLVEVPSGSSSGLQDTPPSVLMKVGDGKTTFGVLPWLSALAADVHAWAKVDATKFTNWLNGTHKLDGSVVSETNPSDCPITFATDADIAALNAILEAHNKRLNDLEAALGVGGGEGNDSISDQVEALKTSLGTPVADEAGKVDGTAYERIAANKVAAAAAQAAAEAAQGDATQALSDAAAAKAAADAADAKADANLATAKTYAEEKASAAETAAKSHAETKASDALTAAKAYTDEREDAIDLAHKAITDAIDSKVTTLVGADTGKSVRTIANEELAAQLIPGNANEALDTLQEIATWIQDHPEDAAAMNDSIAEVRKEVYGSDDGSVPADGSRIDKLETGLSGEIARAEAAEKALDDAIKALNGTGENSVDSKIEAAIATAKTQWEAYADQAETDAVSTANGYADTEIGKEKSRAEGIEAGLQNAINTLNGADTVAGSVAKAAKEAKEAAIAAAAEDATTKANNAKSGAEATAKSYTDTEVAEEKSRAEGVEAGLQNQIRTLVGSQDGTLVAGSVVAKAIADAKQEAINTAAGDATTKANTAKTDAVADAKEYTDGAVATEKGRAEGAEAGLANRITTLEKAVGDTAENSVDTRIETAVNTAATTAQGKADKALTDAKAYTDEREAAINTAHKATTDAIVARPFVSVETNTKTNYVIFNCGSATEVI